MKITKNTISVSMFLLLRCLTVFWLCGIIGHNHSDRVLIECSLDKSTATDVDFCKV